MGNKLGLPDKSKSRAKTAIAEFQGLSYNQIVDAYAYWRLGTYPDLIEKPLFDDIFGNLVSDSDEFFAMFSGGKKHVDVYQVFILLILFTKTTVKKLLTFMFGIQSEYLFKNLSSKMFKTTLNHITVAMNICFNLPIPPTTDIERLSESSFSSFIDRNPEIMKRSDMSSDGEVFLTLEETFRLFEDVKAVSDYIDSIYKACAKEGEMDSFTKASKQLKSIGLVAQEFEQSVEVSTHFSMEFSPTFRSGAMLWKTSMYDLFRPLADESIKWWPVDIGAVDESDLMMKVFDAVVLSGRNAVPISHHEHTSKDKKKVTHNLSTQQKHSSSFNNDVSNRLFSVANLGDEVNIPFEICITSILGLSEYHGDNSLLNILSIFDLYSLLVWVVECCPPELYQVAKEEANSEKLAVAKMQQDRLMRTGIAYYNPDPPKSVIHATVQLKLKAKLTKKNSSVLTLKKLQSMGEQMLFVSSESVCNSPKFKSRPVYRKEHIFLIDQPLINAICMISLGYRSIPVSLNSQHPYKVDTLITIQDVLYYLRNNSNDFFRYLRNIAVSSIEPSIIKRPVLIHYELPQMNLACALYAMASKNVDAAMIVDRSGNACGLLSDKFMLSFYWELKKSVDFSFKMKSFDDACNEYNTGKAKPIDLDGYLKRPPVMNFLSVVLSPITGLEHIGIKLVNISSKLESAPELYQAHLVAEEKKRLLTVDNENDEANEDEDGDNDENRDEMGSLMAEADIVYSDTDEDEDGDEDDDYDDSEVRTDRRSSSYSTSSKNASGSGGKLPSKGGAADNKARRSSSKAGGADSAVGSNTGARPKSTSASSTPATPVTPNATSGAGKGGGKGGKGGKGGAAKRAAEKALADRLLLEQQKKQLALRQFKNKLLGDWLIANSCILDTDDVFAAIEVMYICKTTRAFIATSSGRIIGVVSLKDICQELLRRDEELKEMTHSFLAAEERPTERRLLAKLAAMVGMDGHIVENDE